MEEKRKRIILLIVGIVTLMTLIIGATYAYFQAQTYIDDNIESGVTTGTTDHLTFSLADLEVDRDNITDTDSNIPININADITNFNSGSNSLADGVTGTANLIANDATYNASEDYNVYLNIKTNQLQYTSYTKKAPLGNDEDNIYFNSETKKSETDLSSYNPIPELYLTIKKNGVELKSGVTLNDNELAYVPDVFTKSEDKVGGFDITEAKGLVKIEVPATIVVEGNKENHSKTDTWEIIVTFVNLGTNQNLNTGKSVKAEVLIQTEKLIQDKLLTDANKEKTTLYFHDESLTGGAEDDSYRYAGEDTKVKNFVCLDGGSTSEGPCGADDSDLYRIIGLFKNVTGQYEMKLIKYEYTTTNQLGSTGAYKDLYGVDRLYSTDGSYYKGTEETFNTIGGYFWTSSSNNKNEWVNSELRKTNLNDYYLNTYLKQIKGIDTDNLIETHSWSLNGHDSYSVTPKVMYDNEMNKTEIQEDKIGLMYVSDYGYAVSPSNASNWTLNLNTYNTNIVKDNNWMYRGLFEWTISRASIYNMAFSVGNYYDGGIDADDVSLYAFAVRPCFYLSSAAQIKSGDGSKDSPYRLEL